MLIPTFLMIAPHYLASLFGQGVGLVAARFVRTDVKPTLLPFDDASARHRARLR